ncbi:Putative Methylglyoxal synthase [Clostridium chauvoei JF4335]|nr:Putative Methylglyoxal synthase [Clostridium chauvoei JF4335]
MIEFVKKYKDVFENHNIFATGTTGGIIERETGFSVCKYLSGPLGGDQQIGAKIAVGEIDIVIFFRDPLTAQPHEPDVTALIRLCDVHNTPVATNFGAAEVFLKAIISR